MEKGLLVKDIVGRKPVEGVFVLTEPRLGQGRNGQPYWSLVLRDSSGSIDGKIWFPLSAKITALPDGSLAKITAHASLYRDQTQVVIDELRLLTGAERNSLNMADFARASSRAATEMFQELMDHCQREFTHRPWAGLVFSVFQEPGLKAAFCSMPAAKTVHHAYAGGLLEHTLSVFGLCQLFAQKYPQLDRQTLLAGALFHDLGKIRELSGAFATDYTDEGRLLGHIFLGLELLAPFLAASGLEPKLVEHLRHLILSHHGELEFGAARVPQTMEAFALHFADNLDAKLAQSAQALADTEPCGWSGWQSTLNRNLFLALKTPSDCQAFADDQPRAQSPKTVCDAGNPFDDEAIPFPDDQDIPMEAELSAEDSLINPFQAQKTQQPDREEKKENRAKGQERQCSLLMKA